MKFRDLCLLTENEDLTHTWFVLETIPSQNFSRAFIHTTDSKLGVNTLMLAAFCRVDTGQTAFWDTNTTTFKPAKLVILRGYDTGGSKTIVCYAASDSFDALLQYEALKEDERIPAEIDALRTLKMELQKKSLKSQGFENTDDLDAL